ncbi:hypothetical protein FDO65_03245 [Nakamurella flava]|uniref:NlpC/P60 domain-containing protein n=1 Tax=Nakamurella flava TaxID=2576308 RepID=A0A4U6QJU5_9ACTN|nr:excalibur calcium-binding domain-containing protein [Nakamurella flava]TKV60713.1 hypothetical protein FDO65_03245 [Nakamurella flava]
MTTRGLRRAATGVMLAAVLFTGAVSPAGAVPPPPDNPSDDQIQQSQDDAAAQAAEVGRLGGQVTRTEADIQRLQQDMELKAELANKAAVDLQVAQADAAQASAAAAQAQQDAQAAATAVDDAKAKAKQFAAASFRQGSVVGSVGALLDAGSPTEILQRRELLDQVSASQLNAINRLEVSRNQKTNSDSAARAALDAATAAQGRADAAKQTADQAQQAATAALSAGQDQLGRLQSQLTAQQTAYQQALANAQGLQNQRDQYNQWLAQKAAEEEAARKAAEEAARLAAEEAARQAAAAEAARQAAAQQAAADAAAAAAQQAAAQQAAAQQAAARQAATIENARRAQPTSSGTYYADCNAARDAGAAPINKGEPGYRAELDPNGNGVACDGGADSGSTAGSGSGSTTGSGSGSGSGSSSGSSGSTRTATVSAASSSSQGQTVVAAAKRWLGTQYAWGGGDSDGPTLGIRDGGVADRYGDYNKVGFDCSGLALYAWAQVGVYLPHYSGYQYQGQPKVSRGDLQPGDLVFWAYNTSDPGTIHHVAIYLGDNQIIEAPNSGSYVRISSMYWDGYIGASRPGG